MLYIKWRDRSKGFYHEREWHISEPMPPIDGPVVKFQADGDELNLILRAMKESRSA